MFDDNKLQEVERIMHEGAGENKVWNSSQTGVLTTVGDNINGLIRVY